MFETFFAISESKRDRIRKASLKEFGKYGYRKTSVEQAAKKAGISKGMIFHYFGSKLQYFEYLAEYATEFIINEFKDIDVELNQLDYLERYRLAAKRRLRTYIANPSVFEFYRMLYLYPENQNVSNKVLNHFKELESIRASIMNIINDPSTDHYFRKGLKIDKVKNYVTWLLDGFTINRLSQYHDADISEIEFLPVWHEFNSILNDARKLFYKQEYGGILDC